MTAYEVRISDWSSDVCSSDLDRLLPAVPRHLAGPRRTRPPHRTRRTGRAGDAARDAARAAAVPRRPLTPRRPSPRLQARLPQAEAQVPARGTVRLLTRPAAPAPAGAASLRPEKRRDGNEWGSTCRTTSSADP